MASPRQTRASKLGSHSQIITRHTKPVSRKTDQLTPADAPIAKELNDDGSIVWNEDTEPILFQNILTLKPVGLMKHWRMLMIRKRVSQALDYPVSSQAIWDHLTTLFDVKALGEMEASDKVDKIEAFTLPRSFQNLKTSKITEGSPTKETRLRKISSSIHSKGEITGDGVEDESAKVKPESDTSNPGSPMTNLSEETSRRSNFSKTPTSSKRGKSSEGLKKTKTPTDRPKTPTELKRSRTPTGTKRVKRLPDGTEEEECEETPGSSHSGHDISVQSLPTNGQSLSSTSHSKSDDTSSSRKLNESKHSSGKHSDHVKRSHDSKKSVDGKTASVKKHDSSSSSSSKRVSDSKQHVSSKIYHESKTPGSGKKSSDGKTSLSSSSSSKKTGSSSNNSSKSSKSLSSSRKGDEDSTHSSTKETESDSASKRGSGGKVTVTPKRPRTPTGSSSGKRVSSVSSSGKKSSDASISSSKKSSSLRGSKKPQDDPNDSDDALSSTMNESGRDTPSSTGDSTDTTPASSLLGDSKAHGSSRKRKTASESDRGDSKSVASKDSKSSNKGISIPGKKNRRV